MPAPTTQPIVTVSEVTRMDVAIINHAPGIFWHLQGPQVAVPGKLRRQLVNYLWKARC